MAKYKLLAEDTVTGQLKKSESVSLNVKDFGAKSDGTSPTATLTAINNAISAALATGGQRVYLPAGTYEIDDVLVVPGGVTLFGDGEDKTIIYSQANSRIVNCVEGSGAYATVGPKIYNLQIKGVKSAGTNQIGLAADDDVYMANVDIKNVKVLTCGGHGVYIGNSFSSRFVNIFSSDHNGYPFVFMTENMPGNHYESLYAADLNTGFLCGFRVRRGNVVLHSCNGINASPANSWWAIVGDKNGTDGSTLDRSAYLELHNCNIESSKAGGIKLNYNSVVNFVGLNSFVGDGTASGTYKALQYEVSTDLYPTTFTKGIITDKTVFANSESDQIAGTVAINGTTTVTGTGTSFTTALVVGQMINVNSQIRKIATITSNTSLTVTSAFTGTASGLTLAKYYFAENEPIHANDIPPLMTGGQGIRVTAGAFHNGYYNTTNSRVENLYRSDSFLSRYTVTGTTSLVNPGTRYIELNHSGSMTLTLPWPGWYSTQELIIIKDVSGNASTNNVTINANSGGSVNGSSFTLNKNGQCIGLVPNENSLDYRVVFNYETSPDVINVKAFGAKGDNSTNDTTAVTNAVAAAYSLGKPLYFPSGTYLINSLIVTANSLIIFGDGEGKSILKSNDSTKSVIDIDTTSVVIHSVTIRDLSIQCAGTGANNHGIYVHGTNEPSNLTVRNVRITNCTGSGIYATNGLFTQLYESVDISMLSGGSHAFDITGSNDCTFIRCYVHTVATSKAAYRVRAGAPTFIGCNGIDSGTTCLWGLFGNKTSEDGSDSYVRATFIGTNIEDFTSTGVRFKTGSTGTFIGTTIIAPSTGTVKAIEFDFVDSNLAGIFDAGSSIQTKGASWSNSNAIHSSGLPFIQIGNREFSTYYDTNVAASTSFPGITGTLIPGSTDYALTFNGFTRITNPMRIDEVSAPATPPSNSVYLYAKDVTGTSGLFMKNDAGTETQLTGGGGGAPTSASYLTLGTDGTLTNERVLTGTPNEISLSDGGAGGNLTLSLGSLAVKTNQANTWSTGAQDFGSASSLKIPTGAGAAPTANGLLAYDSTANVYKFGVNGSTKTVLMTDGDGGSLTNLNASNLASGTVPLGRLSGITTTQISGTAGITNAQLANSAVTIGSTSVSLGATAATIAGLTLTTPTIGSFANANHNHTNSAGGGQLTISAFSSTTGSGSVVGATSPTITNGTINQAANNADALVSVRFTDSTPTGNFLRFRNAANNADLFAVDVTGSITAGTVPSARLSGALPALDGSALTSLNASNLGSGTVPLARLSGITTTQISGSAGITNGQLANSAITIAGTSTSLGGSITQDTITGLSTTGLIKRTGANTLAIATAGTDYAAAGAVTSSGLTMSTARLLGRSTASTGAIEEITIGSGLSLSGGTLTATGGSGTPANPTASVGLTAVNGSASTYMRSDAAPALSQSIAPTWTGLHTFNSGTTPANVLLLDINSIGSAGTRDSHNLIFRGRSNDGVDRLVEWRFFNDVTSNAGASTFTIQSRIDAASFADRVTITDAGTVTATAFSGNGASLTNLNASNIASGTIPAGRIQEVLAVTDLTTYASTTGSGTQAIRATTTSLLIGDVLTWNGSDWVNGFNAPLWSDIAGAAANMNLNNSTFNTTISQSTGLWSVAWSGNTVGNSMFKLSSTNTSATGYILDVVADSASSNAKPFRLQARQNTVFDTDVLGNVTISPRPPTSGNATALTITGASASTYTGGTEIVDVNFNLARQVTRNSGAIALDRAVRFQGRTLNFVSTTTVTDAVNVDIETITATGNAIITRSTGLRVKPSAANHHGLWVDGTSAYSADALAIGMSGTRVVRFVGTGATGTINSVFNDTGALSTTATDGFQYISRVDSSSALSGTPTSYSGSSPIVLKNDTVTGTYNLWSYMNSQWRDLSGVNADGFIQGFVLEWVSGTQIRFKTGSAQIQSLGYVVRSFSDITKTPSLSANIWYYCYFYLNSGSPDVEISTTAPASPYYGTARSKTGDSSRRFLGCFRTDGSGNILNFMQFGSGSDVEISWRVNSGVDMRVVTGGLATTNTSVSLSSFQSTKSGVPSASGLVRTAFIRVINLATVGSVFTDTSDSGSSGTGLNPAGSVGIAAFSPDERGFLYHPINSSQELRYSYDSSPSGLGLYIDVYGFRLER